MSLRRRVLLGCLAVALILLAADVALASTFRGFLVAQVDEQLTESAGRLVGFAADPDRPALHGPDPGRRGGARRSGTGAGALSEFYVAVADPDGEVLGRVDTPLRDRTEPEVTAEQVRALAALAVTEGRSLRPVTVGAFGDAGWRMVALRPGGAGGEIVLVGASLQGVGDTYQRMLAVLVIATLIVLATLAAVAWWVLRQGVRPLTAMTATAEAIADGALHERVGDVDERTEAGRLGAALNLMLARIETAFAERAASEGRLRRFVADASHELRTPLTSIRGYTELYGTGALADPEDLDEAMRRVEEEGARMGALVEDLLLLAKLDQGRPLERRPVDLARITTDAVSDLRAVDPTRPVELQVAPVTVTGDDARLRQAVGNLLANVRLHTAAGTPVSVNVASDGGEAVLEVADDGPGMPPEVAGRVFERFYRADTSRVRPTGNGAGGSPGEGSGLGLAIVAGIVEAHEGRITVQSTVGRGTTFRLALPVDDRSER